MGVPKQFLLRGEGWTTGRTLFFFMAMGMILFMTGVIILALSSLHAPEEASIGGVILVGPFPVIIGFGRDFGFISPLILLVLIISLTWIILNLYLYFRRTSRGQG